jgi:heme/copper-type cytochrome/quinol oxidase subunit 3
MNNTIARIAPLTMAPSSSSTNKLASSILWSLPIAIVSALVLNVVADLASGRDSIEQTRCPMWRLHESDDDRRRREDCVRAHDTQRKRSHLIRTIVLIASSLAMMGGALALRTRSPIAMTGLGVGGVLTMTLALVGRMRHVGAKRKLLIGAVTLAAATTLAHVATR